jgi:hypothetical protein
VVGSEWGVHGGPNIAEIVEKLPKKPTQFGKKLPTIYRPPVQRRGAISPNVPISPKFVGEKLSAILPPPVFRFKKLKFV